MEKKTLIGVCIFAVVLLILVSLSNVVGYQTVQLSYQVVINNEVNQKELVFQNIVDIANNKEIQGILLKDQISKGKFPSINTPVLTMKQLKQMYIVGVILSKIISNEKIQSMIEQYQVNNPMMQKELNSLIQKDSVLKRKMKQISDLGVDFENQNTIGWNFPVLCTCLSPLMWFALILYVSRINVNLIAVIDDIGDILNCSWSHMIP